MRWYKFEQPDKRRPVVILTRSSVIDRLGEVTVAPLTSTVRNIPSEVLLSPQQGLERHCVVNLDHLQTVPKRKLGPLVTTLDRDTLEQIRSALLFALEFRA